MGLLDEGSGDDGAVLEHIVQIDEVAVMHMLGEVVRIMKMDTAFVVRLRDVFRQELAARHVAAYFAGHIVALRGHDGRVLIGVLFLRILIVQFEQSRDFVIRAVRLPQQLMLVAVGDVVVGQTVGTVLHDGENNLVLDLLNRRGVLLFNALLFNLQSDFLDGFLAQSLIEANAAIRFFDGVFYPSAVEIDFDAASFANLHTKLPFYMLCCIGFNILHIASNINM